MLQIIKDLNVTDSMRDDFIAALIKKCNKLGVDYKVFSQNDDFDSMQPTIYCDPYTHPKKSVYNNADLHTTSHVCFDIIKDLPPQEILVIGRGIVGRKLIDLIIDNTNHSICVVNSKTSQKHLQTLIYDADIIINTSTSLIHTNCPMYDKILIDVNNQFTCNTDGLIKSKNYFGMGNIGARTTTKIVERAR